MELTTFIEHFRMALGDTGATYEYSDDELTSFLQFGAYGEGYESVSACDTLIIPLVISKAKMSAYMRRARQLSEEGKYEKSLDTERIKVLVDKEKLAEHYIQLCDAERKYYYQLRHNIFRGGIGADLTDYTNNDMNWAPQQDEFGVDTTDWGDEEKEGIKF